MDPLENAPRKVRERLGVLYRFFLYLDFEITTSLKIRIPLYAGKIVICDRYVYDLIMELMLSNLYTTRYGKLLLRTTPCPKKVFFADAPLDIIIQRRPDSNQQRVLAKRNVYRKLAQALGFQTIYTQMTFETNQEQIRRETDLLLKH
jgi:thymidylate kinase